MSPVESLDLALTNLATGLERMRIELDAGTVDKFEAFLKNLSTYNEHTNLVSDANPEVVVNNHLLDSLTLLSFISRLPENGRRRLSLIDIGSGAGFPGLILAIACPEVRFVLVDSVEKKTKFLSWQKDELALENLQVYTGRAEELGHHPQYRGGFDFVTARAVAAVDVIAELGIPLLKSGGKLLLQKSDAQIDSQSKKASKALLALSARLSEVRSLKTDFMEKALSVMVIEKVAKTPKSYPRDWKVIKSRPLGGN